MTSANASRPRLDVADFTKSVEVKTSGPGHGRDLFATRDIAFCEPVLLEKAFMATWSHD